MTIMSTTTVYVVVKFFGNDDILGCQKLDNVYFTEHAAEKRAKAMTRRHNWIWRVIPITIDIHGEQAKIREELAARGISTR